MGYLQCQENYKEDASSEAVEIKGNVGFGGPLLCPFGIESMSNCEHNKEPLDEDEPKMFMKSMFSQMKALQTAMTVPLLPAFKIFWVQTICSEEKKKEIWPSPMTKPPIPTENSKTKGQHTQTPPKTSITQRLRTDLGRSVGVTSTLKHWKVRTKGKIRWFRHSFDCTNIVYGPSGRFRSKVYYPSCKINLMCGGRAGGRQ